LPPAGHLRRIFVQRTPLFDFHNEYAGHMVDFVGWQMPLYYTGQGITAEHHQCRTSGAIFDVSHMGRLKITGRHARKFLERVCTRRITDMQAGQCRYSLVCNPRGGVHDDVIVYRFDEDDFTMVVNASNREKILAHFGKVQADEKLVLKIDDQTTSTAMVALQGPKVMEMVGKKSSEIGALKRYRFSVKNLLIMKIIVSRTGYTGEDGVEVILPAGMVKMALGMLLQDIDMKVEGAVIRPAGLGARDSLRTEAGMPLYGHELGEEINALSCGIDFAIALDKHTHDRGERFIGQDALEKTQREGGPERKLMGFKIEGKRAARQGNTVLKAGKEIGVVTSGCPSPTLGYSVAMAFVDKDAAGLGDAAQIDTGRGMLEAQVVPMPFYKPAK
jgi:aminomethyltransferase